MMKVFDTDYQRRLLESLVGARRQLGGIDLITFEEGHARGTRALDVRTGSGLRFQIMVDRGLDIGLAEFAGTGLAWLPPKGLAGPWYYEGDHDDHAWLRVGLGGLFNTAGLVSMGTPQTVPTQQYGFTQRLSARYGTHDRIAITPAEHVNHGERWDGDRLVLWAEGTVRQDIAYGENLVLTRRYEVDAGTSKVTIRDEVTNEGFFSTPHQILYHFNLGFPFLRWPGRVVAKPAGPVEDLSFSTDSGSVRSPDRWQHVTAPEPGFTHEGFVLPLDDDGPDLVTVAVVTGTGADSMAVFLRTRRSQLPCYVLWRMMREGLFAFGLEPCNSPFGTTTELLEEGWPLVLEPGEQRRYDLEFGVVSGQADIDELVAGITTGADA
jgi:hypothetical protein